MMTNLLLDFAIMPATFCASKDVVVKCFDSRKSGGGHNRQ